MFLALDFARELGAYPGLLVDLRPAVTPFKELINQWSEKDAHRSQFKLRLRRVKASELPEYAVDPETARRRKRRRLAAAAAAQAKEATEDATLKRARVAPAAT